MFAVLLQKCINPPVPATVIDALEFLEKLQAILVSPDKGRHAYHPTKYGQLLVSIPLSLESAIFVVRGGMSGYVRESVVVGAIMDTTPYPILQPFGQQFQVRLCIYTNRSLVLTLTSSFCGLSNKFSDYSWLSREKNKNLSKKT